MSPALIILAVVVFAALAVFFGYLSYKKEQERTAALAATAGEHGWVFTPGRDSDFPRRHARFALFSRGHSRSAFNTMTGAIESGAHRIPFQMGDYRYTITRSTGKSTSSQTYRASYIVVTVPFPGVPDLMIRPEGVLDSMAAALGFDDIDFEDAEFSRMFMVKCTDRRFAYDLCHPRMIEFLKATVPRGPAVVITDGAMCFWTDKGRWDPATFIAWTRTVREFFDLWPNHLVRHLTDTSTGATA